MQTSRCHWHWFQTNWKNHFSPRYFNGIKIETAFKCIFEETMLLLSENFGNHISQYSHKNQYPGPVSNFGFTASQYSVKCWSNLPLQCRIFLIFNTHVTLDHLRDHPIHALVCLFGSSNHVLALKHNNVTSSLYQRILGASHLPCVIHQIKCDLLELTFCLMMLTHIFLFLDTGFVTIP